MRFPGCLMHTQSTSQLQLRDRKAFQGLNAFDFYATPNLSKKYTKCDRYKLIGRGHSYFARGDFEGLIDCKQELIWHNENIINANIAYTPSLTLRILVRRFFPGKIPSIVQNAKFIFEQRNGQSLGGGV